jgi:hypothetical protein
VKACRSKRLNFSAIVDLIYSPSFPTGGTRLTNLMITALSFQGILVTPSLDWTSGAGFAYKYVTAQGAIRNKEKNNGIEESDQKTQEIQEAHGHQTVG